MQLHVIKKKINYITGFPVFCDNGALEVFTAADHQKMTKLGGYRGKRFN